jgi:cyclopropane-fatty-acyl-phospholipid synthase
MFEAVGKKYWPQYFKTVKNSLKDDGVAMIQTITIQDALFRGYTKRGDYIRHYVFPGGLLPSVERFKAQAEKAGLACRDVFLFGQDYARTLREWLISFNKAEPAIRALGYDEPFLRSWRLYLAMCAASFACSRTDVMQVELIHA